MLSYNESDVEAFGQLAWPDLQIKCKLQLETCDTKRIKGGSITIIEPFLKQSIFEFNEVIYGSRFGITKNFWWNGAKFISYAGIEYKGFFHTYAVLDMQKIDDPWHRFICCLLKSFLRLKFINGSVKSNKNNKITGSIASTINWDNSERKVDIDPEDYITSTAVACITNTSKPKCNIIRHINDMQIKQIPFFYPINKQLIQSLLGCKSGNILFSYNGDCSFESIFENPIQFITNNRGEFNIIIDNKLVWKTELTFIDNTISLFPLLKNGLNIKNHIYLRVMDQLFPFTNISIANCIKKWMNTDTIKPPSDDNFTNPQYFTTQNKKYLHIINFLNHALGLNRINKVFQDNLLFSLLEVLKTQNSFYIFQVTSQKIQTFKKGKELITYLTTPKHMDDMCTFMHDFSVIKNLNLWSRLVSFILNVFPDYNGNTLSNLYKCVDRYGFTPLHMAAFNGNSPFLEAVIRTNGTSLATANEIFIIKKTHEGWSVMDYVVQNDLNTVFSLFNATFNNNMYETCKVIDLYDVPQWAIMSYVDYI